MREPVKAQPFMHVMPDNTLPPTPKSPTPKKVSVVDFGYVPELLTTSIGLIPETRPAVLAKRERNARKGQVFRAIEDGTLRAQLAFSRTFDVMLGLR